jgi:hypothetical protein
LLGRTAATIGTAGSAGTPWRPAPAARSLCRTSHGLSMRRLWLGRADSERILERRSAATRPTHQTGQFGCCGFSGARRRSTLSGATQCWVVSIGENCGRRGSAKRGSLSRGNSASASGFCYAIRSITRSSAVALHHNGGAVMPDAGMPVWRCGPWIVTGKMNRRSVRLAQHTWRIGRDDGAQPGRQAKGGRSLRPKAYALTA